MRNNLKANEGGWKKTFKKKTSNLFLEKTTKKTKTSEKFLEKLMKSKKKTFDLFLKKLMKGIKKIKNKTNLINVFSHLK